MLTGPTGGDPENRALPAGDLTVLLARIRRVLQRPPRLWQEVILLAVGFGLYSLIQKDVPLQADAAYDRGRALLELEQRWHIDLQHPLNAALVKSYHLTVLANYYYVALHFMVPIGILLWLIFRHRDRYRAERRSFVLMALIGLAVFWFAPTAPPRLIPSADVIDTVSKYHTIGSYESGATKHAADQFASMPSLHFAFALWVAITMFRLARHRWVRYAWCIYPVLTGLDVLATGNHYLLDLPAGAAALGLGYLISYGCTRWAQQLDHVSLVDHAAPESQWPETERIATGADRSGTAVETVETIETVDEKPEHLWDRQPR